MNLKKISNKLSRFEKWMFLNAVEILVYDAMREDLSYTERNQLIEKHGRVLMRTLDNFAIDGVLSEKEANFLVDRPNAIRFHNYIIATDNYFGNIYKNRAKENKNKPIRMTECFDVSEELVAFAKEDLSEEMISFRI